MVVTILGSLVFEAIMSINAVMQFTKLELHKPFPSVHDDKGGQR